MKEKKYCGVVVPMVTPVNNDGHIDTEAVRKIVTFFAENGVSPLLMGTNGEGNSVSRTDGQLLVETAVKARDTWRRESCPSDFTVPFEQKIYAGLTGNCFSDQVEQANAYTAAGADAIAATVPTYYALTPEQMENYYRQLADAITGPLMLYNITITTHMSIPVDVIERLSHHPNIVGLKDSERGEERMEQCIAIARGREDFSYFCGCAAFSARALELGGDGIVPSTGNFVPQLYRQLYDAALAGDRETALRLQQQTDAIGASYQNGRTLGQSMAALKLIMSARGFCQPHMLLPLTRLNAEEETAIIKLAHTF